MPCHNRGYRFANSLDDDVLQLVATEKFLGESADVETGRRRFDVGRGKFWYRRERQVKKKGVSHNEKPQYKYNKQVIIGST